jgi:hypothetical protein
MWMGSVGFCRQNAEKKTGAPVFVFFYSPVTFEVQGDICFCHDLLFSRPVTFVVSFFSL